MINEVRNFNNKNGQKLIAYWLKLN